MPASKPCKKVNAFHLMLRDVFHIHQRGHADPYPTISSPALRNRTDALNGRMPPELKRMYTDDARAKRWTNEIRLNAMLDHCKNSYPEHYIYGQSGGLFARARSPQENPNVPIRKKGGVLWDQAQWQQDSDKNISGLLHWKWEDANLEAEPHFWKTSFCLVVVQSYVKQYDRCWPSEVALLEFTPDGSILREEHFIVEPGDGLTSVEQAEEFALRFSHLQPVQLTSQDKKGLRAVAHEVKKFLRNYDQSRLFCLPDNYAEVKMFLDFCCGTDKEILSLLALPNAIAERGSHDPTVFNRVQFCPSRLDLLCQFHQRISVPFCVLGVGRQAIDLVCQDVAVNLGRKRVGAGSADWEHPNEKDFTDWLKHVYIEVGDEQVSNRNTTSPGRVAACPNRGSASQSQDFRVFPQQQPQGATGTSTAASTRFSAESHYEDQDDDDDDASSDSSAGVLLPPSSPSQPPTPRPTSAPYHASTRRAAESRSPYSDTSRMDQHVSFSAASYVQDYSPEIARSPFSSISGPFPVNAEVYTHTHAPSSSPWDSSYRQSASPGPSLRVGTPRLPTTTHPPAQEVPFSETRHFARPQPPIAAPRPEQGWSRSSAEGRIGLRMPRAKPHIPMGSAANQIGAQNAAGNRIEAQNAVSNQDWTSGATANPVFGNFHSANPNMSPTALAWNVNLDDAISHEASGPRVESGRATGMMGQGYGPPGYERGRGPTPRRM